MFSLFFQILGCIPKKLLSSRYCGCILHMVYHICATERALNTAIYILHFRSVGSKYYFPLFNGMNISFGKIWSFKINC